MSAPADRAGAPRPRPALWIAAVLAAIGLGMVVSGPVHHVARWIRSDVEFARTFRLVTLVLVVGVLLAWWRPWRDVPRDLYGLRGPRARPALWLAGAALAIVGLAALAAPQFVAGWLRFDPDGVRKLAKRWPETLGRGVLLGFVEELAFRGWVLARLRRRFALFPAALVTAAIFGVLHAFRVTDSAKDAPPDVSGAWTVLGSWASNVVHGPSFWPRFVGVVLLSLLLTAVFVRTKTLWADWGLHGGAVIALDAISALTERDVERNWAGSKWLYDGVPGFLLMAVLVVVVRPRGEGATAGSSRGAGPSAGV